jgi:uncharacterized protein (DUF952 family)
MATIYKLCPAGLWDEAVQAGRFAGSAVDHADGYIHFSGADQVAETAWLHFRGETDLVLVAVDGDRLGPALRYERSRAGALYPHLYGPLPLAAVLWARPLPLAPDGRHRFPDPLPP